MMNEGGNMLTRDQILGAKDRKTVTVPVPEWGGPVAVAMLTAAERDEFDAAVSRQTKDGRTDMKGLRALLVSMCAVDDTGARLFTEKDVAALNTKAARPVARVFDAACKLNAIGVDAEEEALGN